LGKVKTVDKFQALRDIVTCKDGVTHDIGRWGGVLALISGIAFQGWALYKGQPFDMLNFGAGVAALAAGVGAMLKLKETTES
tara:strand:+ start:794 stop:1039 length:246 start_codon:yes stop_codon:yes gene_type:complete